jgi:hypothetical protein
MQRWLTHLFSILTLTCLLAPRVGATDYIYLRWDIPFPDMTSTVITDITDQGALMGVYHGGGLEQGFLRQAGQLMPLLFVLPRSMNEAEAIVGTYTAVRPHGFLLAQGTLTVLDVPALSREGPQTFSTNAEAITEAGLVLGNFRQTDGVFGMFQYTQATQQYTRFTVPLDGAIVAVTSGNDAGTLIGLVLDHDMGTLHGWQQTPAGLTLLDVPGAAMTEPMAVNTAGVIAGTASFDPTDAQGNRGWVLVPGGDYQILHVPGAVFTEVYGLSESGQIVGRFWDGDRSHGFLALPWAPPWLPLTVEGNGRSDHAQALSAGGHDGESRRAPAIGPLGLCPEGSLRWICRYALLISQEVSQHHE